MAAPVPDDRFDDSYVDDRPLGTRPISFLVLLSAVVAMILLVGSVFVERVGLAAVDGGPALVEVPQLIGTDRAAAERLLARAGLAYVITEAQNVAVASGLVIEQRPQAGERVGTDTTVAVVISSGDDFTRVPDIGGSQRAELELLLMVHGLELGEVDHREDDRAPGEVIDQDPAPGALLPRGTPVHVVLSSGPPMVEIPDVRNLELADARQTLLDAGFRVAVQERFSRTVARGSAMSTEPADEAPRGSQLVLYISRGVPPTTTTTEPQSEPQAATSDTPPARPSVNRGGHETYEPFEPPRRGRGPGR